MVDDIATLEGPLLVHESYIEITTGAVDEDAIWRGDGEASG